MISKVYKFLRWKLRGEIPTERLIKMGLKVGRNFHRQDQCIIDYSHCWLITIGDNVTLAPKVHILAHDASTKHYTGYTKIGLVKIGNNVFIGAGVTIMPNVKIGDNVIIGAGSIVTKDIPDNSLAYGNPAIVVSGIEEYIIKNQELMRERPVYDESYTIRKNIDDFRKNKMIEELKNGIGYIE